MQAVWLALARQRTSRAYMEMLADIDPLLRELGRLVFNFNSAEHQLRRLAFLFIDPESERTGEITIDRLGANGLEELVRALAPYRLSSAGDLPERIGSAVTRFGGVRVQRNNFVHASWVLPNDSTSPDDIVALRRRFRRGENDQLSRIEPRLVREIASEAASIGSELEALYDHARRVLTD